MRFCLVLISIILFGEANCQTAIYTSNDISLIGIQSLKDGVLVVSGSEKKDRIKVEFLDVSGSLKWSNYLDFKRNSRKPRELCILNDDRKLVFLHLSNDIRRTVMSIDGHILESNRILSGLESRDNLDPNCFIYMNKTLIYIDENGHYWSKYDFIEEKSKFQLSHTLSDEGSEKTIRFSHLTKDELILGSTYYTSGTKDTMVIDWKSWDKELGSLRRQRRNVIATEDASFRYFSPMSDDKYETMRLDSGFITIGKLYFSKNQNYLLERKELTTGPFIGFWIAFWNELGEVINYSDFKFMDYPDQIPSGILHWDHLVDAKEDNQGGVFVNFTKPSGVVTSDQLIFHISKTGSLLNAQNLKVESGLMNYNNSGLRHVSKKHRIRLSKDDWRYYSTSYIPYLSPYPELLQAPMFLIQKRLGNYQYRTDVAFNFVKVSDSQGLVFEYTKTGRKKGNLIGYRYLSGNLEF